MKPYQIKNKRPSMMAYDLKIVRQRMRNRLFVFFGLCLFAIGSVAHILIWWLA